MKRSQKAGMAVQHILAAIQRQPEKREHQQVRTIVDLLMRLCNGDRDDPMQIAQIIQDEDTLDGLLSAYTWKAAALFSDGKLRIGFQPDSGSGWEGSAIATLVRFAESEELGRLRECKACHRLFYAFRADKTFCNARCKAKNYDADPEHHAARLERLRNNYANPPAKRKRRKRGSGRS